MSSQYIVPLRDKINYLLATAQYVPLIDLGKKILTAARKEQNKPTEALALVGFAIAHRRIGKFADARVFAEGAVELALSIHNGLIAADALTELGYVRLYGYFQPYEARQEFEEALNISHNLNDEEGIRHAQLGLAYTNILLGTPDTAIYSLLIAYQSAVQALDTVSQVEICMALGQAYLQTRQLYKAEQMFLIAKHTSEELNYTAYTHLITIGLVRAKHFEDREAIIKLADVLDNAEKAHDFLPQMEAVHSLVHILTHSKDPQFPRAYRYANHYLNLAQTSKSKAHEANAFSLLGQLSFLQRNYTQALEDYQHALQLSQEGMNPYQEGSSWQAMAIVNTAQGDHFSTVNHLSNALGVFESLEHQTKVNEINRLMFFARVRLFIAHILEFLGLR
jgi:tetratricopeptide (TPR) repeat protein